MRYSGNVTRTVSDPFFNPAEFNPATAGPLPYGHPAAPRRTPDEEYAAYLASLSDPAHPPREPVERTPEEHARRSETARQQRLLKERYPGMRLEAKALVIELLTTRPQGAICEVKQVQLRHWIPFSSRRQGWAKAGELIWPVGERDWTVHRREADSSFACPTGLTADARPVKIRNVAAPLRWRDDFEPMPVTEMDLSSTPLIWQNILEGLERDVEAVRAGAPLPERHLGPRLEAVVKVVDLATRSRSDRKAFLAAAEVQRRHNVGGRS